MKQGIFVLVIVFLLVIFAMNSSFAATNVKSESISSTKIVEYIDYHEAKISNIKRTDNGEKSNFKVFIKKPNQKKYKIKSVQAVYVHTTISEYGDNVNKKVYKNYTSKNKKSLAIKDLSASEKVEGNYRFVKIIINYENKKKVKKESHSLKKNFSNYKEAIVYKGKTAVVKDITKVNKKNFSHIIKVKANNSKYKIKTFKTIFYEYKKSHGHYHRIVRTFYGNRKNSLVVKGPLNYDPRAVGEFKIEYY